MPDDVRERVVDQFSGRGDRADVWRLLDLAVDTDSYLNLGYSGRYQTHLLGSPQRRLADVVGRALADALPATAGVRLLDVGSGRGGPAIRLAERFGFDVVGVDLVPHNVTRAGATAGRRGVDAAFAVGDVTRLPVAEGAVAACTAVDSLVYVPDRAAALEAIAGAVEPGGVLALSDLVAAPDLGPDGRRAVESFAEAWDMPPLAARQEYERALADAGFEVRAVADLTPHSVGRFRRFTRPALALLRTPAGSLAERLLRARGIDYRSVREQVRRANRALPHLGHVMLVAERVRPSR